MLASVRRLILFTLDDYRVRIVVIWRVSLWSPVGAFNYHRLRRWICCRSPWWSYYHSKIKPYTSSSHCVSGLLATRRYCHRTCWGPAVAQSQIGAAFSFRSLCWPFGRNHQRKKIAHSIFNIFKLFGFLELFVNTDQSFSRWLRWHAERSSETERPRERLHVSCIRPCNQGM